MTDYDMINRINKMATCPAKYRKNWLKAAKRQAKGVQAEIARLRKFADHKPGFVADRSRSTADDLEARLTQAMEQFE